MGTILTITAFFLSFVLYPISILLTAFKALYKRQWKTAFKRLDRQFLAISASIDASGNVVCKDVLNSILITNNGYQFGNRKETISSVLGKNERDQTLTKLGKYLVKILNKIDKDHCLKSIDNNI